MPSHLSKHLQKGTPILIEINELKARNNVLQARIDRLMQEYCPEGMTEAQWKEWECHQIPVLEKDNKTVAWKCTIGCLPYVGHSMITGKNYLTHDHSLCTFCMPITQSELTKLEKNDAC